MIIKLKMRKHCVDMRFLPTCESSGFMTIEIHGSLIKVSLMIITPNPEESNIGFITPTNTQSLPTCESSGFMMIDINHNLTII